MNYVAIFFAGAFFCNSVPHLTYGLQGTPFPTPFAKPRGVGESSPFINFMWGIFNLIIGICLLSRHPMMIGFNPDFITLFVGILAMGTHLSLHFGKVQREKPKK